MSCAWSVAAGWKLSCSGTARPIVCGSVLGTTVGAVSAGTAVLLAGADTVESGAGVAGAVVLGAGVAGAGCALTGATNAANSSATKKNARFKDALMRVQPR